MENISRAQIKVGLADDHLLLRTALTKIVNDFKTCKVILEASNGSQLLEMLKTGVHPDVLVLDLNMPGLNG